MEKLFALWLNFSWLLPCIGCLNQLYLSRFDESNDISRYYSRWIKKRKRKIGRIKRFFRSKRLLRFRRVDIHIRVNNIREKEIEIENPIVIFRIGLYSIVREVHLLSTGWVYTLELSSSLSDIICPSRGKGQTTGRVSMVGASKSWNEHGGCIRALVRLARKLDIFLPLRVIGRGRGEERGRTREEKGGEGEGGGWRKKRGERGRRSVNRDPESISRRNLK